VDYDEQSSPKWLDSEGFRQLEQPHEKWLNLNLNLNELNLEKRKKQADGKADDDDVVVNNHYVLRLVWNETEKPNKHDSFYLENVMFVLVLVLKDEK
jgi:hypothetical protein